MSAFSSRGTRIYLTKGSAAVDKLAPTAISKAKPAVVTVANSAADGDLVMVKSTGFSELDGKVFKVGNASGTDFELVGSDTTGSSGTLTTAPEIDHYLATDLVSLCLSSFTVNNTEPGTTSVATFCDPSASLPAATQEAGTVSIGGYVNEKDVDYLEMIMATEDGKTRLLEIVFPSHGSLVAPVTFGAMGYDIPIDGAPAWSATGVLGSKFQHLF